VHSDPHHLRLHFRQLHWPVSENDLGVLHAMRVASGTCLDLLESTWLPELQARTRLLFLVYLCDTAQTPVSPLHPMSPATLTHTMDKTSAIRDTARMDSHCANFEEQLGPPIAMASLYLENPLEPTLASFSTTKRAEITSLWVYSAYRHLGIAGAVIAQMERRAAALGALYTTCNMPVLTEGRLKALAALGYKEFRPREHRYRRLVALSAGLPADAATVAAFFEKKLTTVAHRAGA
jgi:ribosomal protein S18 acetylase RimI-like enzyme